MLQKCSVAEERFLIDMHVEWNRNLIKLCFKRNSITCTLDRICDEYLMRCRYQNPIDISRAATLSPDLQNDLQNLKPSRQFSENRLVFIFMNKFFFYIRNEQEKRALYMHTRVNTYALKCMQISLLRAAPFISWQWVLVKICGEKLLAFFVNNYYTCLERKHFLKRFGNKSSI